MNDNFAPEINSEITFPENGPKVKPVGPCPVANINPSNFGTGPKIGKPSTEFGRRPTRDSTISADCKDGIILVISYRIFCTPATVS